MNFDNLVFMPFVDKEAMITFSVIMLLIVLVNRKHIINRILMIILLFIISQRPIIIQENEQVSQYDSKLLDIIFIVDRTVSMNAIDVDNNTRLEAIKKDCNKIIETFPDSYYLLMLFDTFPNIEYPLVNEIGILKEMINNIDIVRPNNVSGVATLKAPYEELKNVLKTPKRDRNVKRIVFFMSDGEVNSSNKEDKDFSDYKDISSMIDNGMVIGYGTASGAKIKVKDTFLNNGNAVSKIDENNLKTVASNLKIDYIHRINSNDIEKKLEDIKKIIENDNTDDKINIKGELYSYFTGALLVLLLLELLYYRRVEQ